MKRLTMREMSLSRKFALLSLIIIALITAFQATVQWGFLRENLLEGERTNSALVIREGAFKFLRVEDFAHWQSPEAQSRFERFFRQTILNPEILRVKLYDSEMRVVWSDEPRLLGARFSENDHLGRALQGHTVAHLEHADKPENLYERGFPRTVELYVPLAFLTGKTSDTANVVGVVEVYKHPVRVLANIWRGRLTIVATALAGGLVLYAALFGIVHRASHQLQAQRENLERQTVALGVANQQLRATQGQLQVAERLAAIGEVSAAVAHGIRNPLANIRASAQVALDCLERPGTVKKYLTSVTGEVDRLDRWLRALLDLVHPFEPRLAPVELNAVIEDLLTVLGGRVAQGKIKLERRLASDLPPLMADEIQLQQALLCVLNNSLDVLPPDGMLSIQTERADGRESPAVRVIVQDNGEGVPADRLGRIFEPFFTTKSQGTGLGLAITRKVVEGHGGWIQLESEPEIGTTVRITLPVKAPVSEVV